jgi:hypothetical protein
MVRDTARSDARPRGIRWHLLGVVNRCGSANNEHPPAASMLTGAVWSNWHARRDSITLRINGIKDLGGRNPEHFGT